MVNNEKKHILSKPSAQVKIFRNNIRWPKPKRKVEKLWPLAKAQVIGHSVDGVEEFNHLNYLFLNFRPEARILVRPRQPRILVEAQEDNQGQKRLKIGLQNRPQGQGNLLKGVGNKTVKKQGFRMVYICYFLSNTIFIR